MQSRAEGRSQDLISNFGFGSAMMIRNPISGRESMALSRFKRVT